MCTTRFQYDFAAFAIPPTCLYEFYALPTKIQITILFCSEFFIQSKTRNTKYMCFSWGNCIILLLCYRTCQKYTKSFKTEKYCRNSPIMQYYSYHLITSCSQNLIFNIFCYLIMQLRANIHFSVTASAFSPFRHCEGIYARGNPLHETSITLSLRGHLCPWQSPTWNKYSNYTVLVPEIASSLRSSQ